jgi:hypothetical protein
MSVLTVVSADAPTRTPLLIRIIPAVDLDSISGSMTRGRTRPSVARDEQTAAQPA